MPIPGTPVPPTPAVPVVADTSLCTFSATVDPASASVLLLVKFKAPAVSAVSVTVTRSGGSTGNVRGLDQRPAPSGITAGIDHEPARGVSVTYQATATARDGSTWTSGALAVAVPFGSALLKCLTIPSLSQPLTVQDYGEWDNALPMTAFQPFSRPDPTVRFGVPQLGQGSLVVTTRDSASSLALQALLASGGLFLLQPSAQSGEPDRYVARQAVKRTRPFQQSAQPRRDTTIPLLEIARPYTAGTSVAIPGHTFADSRRRFPTFADRTGTFLDRMIS